MAKAIALIFVFMMLSGFSAMALVHADSEILLQSNWDNSNGSVSDNGIWSYVAVSGNPPNYADMSVVQAPGQTSGDYALQFTSSPPDSGYSSGWDECIDYIAPVGNLQPQSLYQSIMLTADVYFQNLPTKGFVNVAFIMSMYTNSPTGELLIGAANENGAAMWAVGDEGPGIVSNIPVNTGVWYHISITATAGSPFTFDVSINGQQIASDVQAPDGASSFNIAGVGGDNTCSGVTVNIDNVYIFDPVLPQNVVPETPYGVITPIVVLFAATAVYITAVRRRATVNKKIQVT